VLIVGYIIIPKSLCIVTLCFKCRLFITKMYF